MLNEYNHLKRKKLTQHFKDKMGPTEVLFLQELTLTIKSNKNRKEIFKVMFSCSLKKKKSYGVWTAYFEKKLLLLKRRNW